MPKYYKATKCDGTSFLDGKTRWVVGETTSVEPIEYPQLGHYGVLHANTAIGEVLHGNSYQWPCRVFEVEGGPVVHYRDRVGAFSWDVIREVDPTLMFGSEGRRVARVLAQIREMDTRTSVRLVDAWEAARSTAYNAARSKAESAAYKMTLSAACYAAWFAVCSAVWYYAAGFAIRSAALALITKDNISQGQFDLLMQAWISVMGYPEPLSDDEVRELCGAEFVGSGPVSKDIFTADLHLGHGNIIKHCGRPYADIDEMNEAIRREWIAKVDADDRIFLLGDLVWGRFDLAGFIGGLPGRKHWILGNHDMRSANSHARLVQHFDSVQLSCEVECMGSQGNQRTLFMSHYAHRVWPSSGRGTWHLYGHSHGTLPDDPFAMSMDVGVDANGMRFLTIEDIEAHMARKTPRPADHHGANNRD